MKVIAYVSKHTRVFEGFWETLAKETKNVKIFEQLCPLES